MLRIDGIMTGRNRMFDTPGVPHNHQLSTRLTPDEVNQAINSMHLPHSLGDFVPSHRL